MHFRPQSTPPYSTWCYIDRLLAQVVIVGVEEGELLQNGLFGDEVEHLRHMAVLDDGHTLDGAAALDVPVLHALAAARAAQLAQAVESRQGRHGSGFLPSTRTHTHTGGQAQSHNPSLLPARCSPSE